MVNTHLKIQQTEVTVGLERLQVAPKHSTGRRLGRPSTAGTRRRRKEARGWRRSTSGGERRGFSHSASQRPEERKTEFEPGKRGQKPSARERREGREAERG